MLLTTSKRLIEKQIKLKDEISFVWGEGDSRKGHCMEGKESGPTYL
jgi:hypothetical protein